MNRRAALRTFGLSALAGWTGGPGILSSPALAAQPATGTPPDVEIEMRAAPGEVPLFSGAPTKVWRFTARLVRGPVGTVQPVDGSYLGPTLRLRRGQRVRIRFHNELGEPSIIHWHGLDVPAVADGHPRLAVGHGQEYLYDFEVTNRAGTYWYHPHPHMRTAPQVYQGLAGLLIVTDPEEEALGLPNGPAELLCVLQDRRIDDRNQWVYAGSAAAEGGRRGRGRGPGMGMGMGGMGGMMETMNGWLGDRLLVNGRERPVFDVDRRACRVRLLNGSNARIYRLGWSDGLPMTVIGGDGGLMARARTQPFLTLAPGQRADLLVDLSERPEGSRVELRTLAFDAEDVGRVGMMGETSLVPQGAAATLAVLRVGRRKGKGFRLPDRLSDHGSREVADAPVRRVPLTFMRMNWLIDGRTFDMQDVAEDETVGPGETRIWEFENRPNPMGMAMAHPMHVHGPQFRVLSRTGGDGEENGLRAGMMDAGWLDTVLVLPGETVQVQIRFSRHPGLYLYHCHILEHEDMGMMRNFRITGSAG